MQPLFNSAGAAGLFCLSFVAASVQAADWNGSYSVDGACYCSGKLDSALARRMSPTPIGGQTIAQICERVGKGPGVKFNGSLFSQPVYLDAQCGNGPFVRGTRPDDENCSGSYDLMGKDCVGVGPRWDLKAAYGSDAASLAASQNSKTAKPAIPASEKQASVNKGAASAKPRVKYVGGDVPAQAKASEQNVNRSSGSVYRRLSDNSEKQASQQVASNSAVNASSEKSTSKLAATDKEAQKVTDRAAEKAAADMPLPEGVVTMDGIHYVKAPAGTPRKGGAAGSRIVLDGELFVKYVPKRNPTDEADKTPTLAAANASELEQKKALARQKVEARAKARKIEAAKARKAAKKAKAAKLAKAASTKKTREQRAAERQARQEAELKRAEARQAARAARTEKLLADARLRLQRRNARVQKELQAQELADAQARADAEARAEEAQLAERSAQGQAHAGIDRMTGGRTAALDDQELDSSSVEDDSESRLSQADTERAVDESTAAVATQQTGSVLPSISNALRMPAGARTSSREFAYVDAMPVNYAFGGGGVAFEASATNDDRIRMLARLGVASEYKEVLVGASMAFTPPAADRMTVVGTVGLEAGQFALEASDVSTAYEDAGVFVGIASRFVVNGKFELQGGIGYSSFFNGDLTANGGAFYHLNRQLDIVSRFELGDNDSLGIGVRYYY